MLRRTTRMRSWSPLWVAGLVGPLAVAGAARAQAAGCVRDGGWTCVLVAHGGGRAAHSGRPGGSGGVDPGAVCLAARICEDVAFSEPGPRVSTGDLAAMAAAAIALPAPVPHTGPAGKTYVNLATDLWVEDGVWRTYHSAASAGGQTVSLTGRPARVVWDTGEAMVECDRAYCSYTYLRPTTGRPDHIVTATVYYAVTWTCDGPCDARSGTYPALPASGGTRLAVGEIQTVSEMAG